MQLNLIGSFNTTSYGCVLVNVAKELAKLCDVSFFPALPGSPGIVENVTVDSNQELWKVLNSYMPDFTAPSLKIWHQNQLDYRVGKGLMSAFSFFELDTLDEREVLHMSAQDSMLVASEWAKEIAAKYDIDTTVVPLGVDNEIFYPVDKELKQANRGQLGINETDYVFYISGKFEVRKAHAEVFTWFRKAFPSEKDVKLLVNCWSPNLTPEVNQQWASYFEQDPRCVVIKTRFPNQQQVAAVVSTIDCGVYPSKAEGWNLPALECLAMDKPVILNNYAAHKEYADYCTAIEPKGMERAYDGIWFKGTGNWSIPDKDGFIEAMRDHYHSRKTVNLNNVAEKFSWKNSANKILDILSI